MKNKILVLSLVVFTTGVFAQQKDVTVKVLPIVERVKTVSEVESNSVTSTVKQQKEYAYVIMLETLINNGYRVYGMAIINNRYALKIRKAGQRSVDLHVQFSLQDEFKKILPVWEQK